MSVTPLRLRHFPSYLPLLACAALLASCDGAQATDSGAPVARIEVTPPTLTMVAGETRALGARALDAAGATLGGRRLLWSSADASVATVSQAGIVTAVAAGTTEIAVSAGGKSALVPITVTARPAAVVRISPSTSTIQIGETTTLTVSVLDAVGDPVIGRPTTWSSSNQGVATVDARGVVTGIAPGTATLTARVDNVSGTAVIVVQLVPVERVNVTPASDTLLVGQSRQLSVSAEDAAGRTITGRTTLWSSSAPLVASVSSTGTVIALAPGVATITATVEGKSASARISVSLAPVASVTVIPASATLAVDQSGRLTAQLIDVNGNIATGRPVAWTTSDPNIATVASDGTVTAMASGTATVTATSEGKSGRATITVNPVPVASVDVTPNTVSLQVGSTRQLTATTFDAQGRTLSGRIVTWISGAPSVANVDARGLVTAIGPGSALIIATSEGRQATVSVTVSPASVSRVAVTPSSGSLQPGGTLQLSASVQDSRGATIPGKVPSWTTSNSGVATVSSSGLVTAVAPGQATITATSDGVSDNAVITVTAVAVASLTVLPSSGTLVVGGTLTFSASLFDASGNPIPPAGRTITWSTSNSGVATVSSSGNVTAVAPGSATITARSGSASDQATITVTAAPVASVNVAPASSSLTVGGTIQLSATALDASGRTLTGRTVSWSSSDVSIATVSSSGLVRAVGSGSAQITADVGGVQGVAGISVAPPPFVVVPVATVEVTPNTATVEAGKTVALTATPRDSAGNALSGRAITWSSSDTRVATVSASGVVSGVAPGSVTITATADSAGSGGSSPRGTSAVTVVAPAPSRITVSPLAGSLHVGQLYSRQVSAQALDASGAPVPGQPIAWSSSDPARVVVAPQSSGSSAILTATAMPSGGVTVTASAQGTNVASQVAVTVTLVAVRSVAVVPLLSTLALGDTVRLSVTARDSAGNVIGTAGGNPLGGRVPAFRSNDSRIASVDAAGLVTAGSAGATTIDATLDGVGPARVGVIVLPASQSMTVDTIESIPSSSQPTLTVQAKAGERRQASFRVRDTNGATMAGVPFTVSSSDGSRATVAIKGSSTTDKDGEGRFEVTMTSRIRRGDVVHVTVSAGNKSTTWQVRAN